MPGAAAAPAQPVPADAEHIGRAWPTILARLEEGAPHLHAFLQGSQVQAVADGTVTIAVNGGVAVTMLGRPDEKARITAMVREVCAQDLAVEFREAAPAPAAHIPSPGVGAAADGPVDHQQIIDEIRAAFDAELIDTENRE